MASETDDDLERGSGMAGAPQVVDALALIPVVGQAMQYFISFVPAVAKERVRQTLTGLLDVVGEDQEWLVQQLEARPEVCHLLARLSRGVSEDTDEAFAQKLQIYQEIVRRGIVDDAEVDPELIRLAAVAELTTLDLRVLMSFDALTTAAHRADLSGHDLMNHNGLQVATAQATFGHLERLTLLQASGLTYAELEGSDSGIPSRLVMTEFGHEVLAMLGGEPDEPEAPAPAPA